MEQSFHFDRGANTVRINLSCRWDPLPLAVERGPKQQHRARGAYA